MSQTTLPDTNISLERLIAQIDSDAARGSFGMGLDAPRRDSATNMAKHVVFALEGTLYAVPMANVLEIQRPPRITTLPHVPEWLRGVTNMRGEVLSVVDLRMLLGLPALEGSKTERLVVVQSTREEIAVGLVVDQVVGIRGIGADALQPCSALMSGPLASFIRGVIEQDERLIAVLDVNRVLASPELRQFELAS